jgi:hypothetical protein
MSNDKPKKELQPDDITKALQIPIKITPVEQRDITRRIRKISTVKDMGEDERVSDFWRQKKSKTKIGLASLFCIICIAVYMIYVTGLVVYNILLHEFNMNDLIYYTVLLLLGIGAFIGGLRLARNIILFEHLVDTTFEEEIYVRLEPALREVAKVQVEMDEMKLKMDRMNLNVNLLRDKPPEYIDPVKSIESRIVIFLRYVLLINLSLGILIYMLLYPSEFTPYVLTLMYPLWWVVITAEFKLWKVDEAYAWVFLPILVVPIAIIVLDVIIIYGSLLGLIGACLLLYVLGYRTWAKFYVEGRTPMEVINNIANNKNHRLIRSRTLKGK